MLVTIAQNINALCKDNCSVLKQVIRIKFVNKYSNSDIRFLYNDI